MSLEALMAEGQQALQAGDVAAALHAYEQAAAFAPDDLGLAWIRGVLLVRLERYQDALPFLVRAQALPQQAASVWTHLGIAHTFLGNPDEALAAYQRAVQAGPGDPNVRIRLATALNDTGQPAEALGVLDQAVPLADDPTVAGFLFLQRGVSLNALSRPEEAVAALDLVGELGGDPGALAALALQRAVAYNGARRHEEALAAVDTSPPTPRPGPASLQRAIALNKLGRPGDALVAVGAALADPATGSAAALQRGIALVGTGDDTEGLVVLGQAVPGASGPSRVAGLEAQGTAMARTGQAQGAVAAFTEAVSEAAPGPDRGRILAALARGLAALDRPADAVAALDRAFAEVAPDADSEVERAGLLHQAGRSAEALAALDRAARQHLGLAGDADFQRRRLAIGLTASSAADAAALLADAAAADPARSALLQVAGADALAHSGQPADAAALLEHAARLEPAPAVADQPWPWLGQALAALALGRTGDADLAFDRAVGAGAELGQRPAALTGALVALGDGDAAAARDGAEAVAATATGADPLADVVAGLAAAAGGDRAGAADAFDRAVASTTRLGPVAAAQRAWLALEWGDPAAPARFAELPTADLGLASAAVEAGRALTTSAEPAAAAARLSTLSDAASALPAGHPGRSLLWSAEATVLGQLGRHDEALLAYERAGGSTAGEGHTGDAVALLGLGATYARLEDAEPALRAFQRAHDAAINDRQRVLALSGQGDALVALGDGEKALEAHRSAIRIDPADASVWAGLGAAYRRLGRVQAAESAFGRAVELGGEAQVGAVREALTPPAPATPVRSASWPGFWFHAWWGRRLVGGLLVAAVVILALLSVIDPSEVGGLGWVTDEGPGALAAPLLAALVLLVAPAFGREAGPAEAPPPAARPPVPTLVPLPSAADLAASARSVGTADVALAVATDLVVLGAPRS
jgi:superkiller protein 3